MIKGWKPRSGKPPRMPPRSNIRFLPLRAVFSVAMGKARRYSEDMRWLTTLLMIFSLLSCPLRCAIGSGCVDALPSVKASPSYPSPSCCNACSDAEEDGTINKAGQDSHRPTTDGRSTVIPCPTFPCPTIPCHDCGCQACICNGAMVEWDTSGWRAEASVSYWVPLNLFDLEARPRSFGVDRDDRSEGYSIFIGGRVARIVLQSFQI